MKENDSNAYTESIPYFIKKGVEVRLLSWNFERHLITLEIDSEEIRQRCWRGSRRSAPPFHFPYLSEIIWSVRSQYYTDNIDRIFIIVYKNTQLNYSVRGILDEAAKYMYFLSYYEKLECKMIKLRNEFRRVHQS